MKIGMTSVFHNPHDKKPDGDVLARDLRLADLAEPLGFDSLWTVEHHFDDYCLSPDPFQTLTWFAARTERIQLGSMVVVIPWWKDPVRLAEKAILLDHFSGGRFIFGVGRGAAFQEFEGFGVPMEESRERFDEAARMIFAGLESGTCEYAGEFVQQSPVTLRPAPRASFAGRRFSAATSPASAEIAAELGLGLLLIIQKPWEMTQEDIAIHRKSFLSHHGQEPPTPIVSLIVYCDEDRAQVDRVRETYVHEQASNVNRHYDFTTKDRSTVKGYEAYAARPVDFVEQQAALQVIGTPEECVEYISRIGEMTGTEHFVGIFSFAGLPEEMAEKSIRLFAERALPNLHSLSRSAA